MFLKVKMNEGKKDRPKNASHLLNVYFSKLLGDDFVWGKTHCTALAFGATDAVYGTDLYEWHKKTHKVQTEKDALKLSQTKETLKFFETEFVEVDLYSLRTGDILYVYDGKLECCYVWTEKGFVGSEVGGIVGLKTYHETLNEIGDKEYKIFSWDF